MRFEQLCARYVTLARRHAVLLTLVFLGIGALALLCALHLELRTDLAELLPKSHPAVAALRQVAGRQKSATNLVLLIEGDDPARNRRFVDTLEPELARLMPSLLSEIEWQPDNEIAGFGEHWRWLYAERADLEHATELLDRVAARHSSPLYVDMEGDAEAQLRELGERLAKAAPPQREQRYFEADHGRRLGLRLWRRRDGFGTIGDRSTLAAVRAVVARVRAQVSRAPAVHYTGHIAQTIDEQDAIRDDLTLATLVCTTLIILAIYLYFRRVALLVVVGTPAVLGLLLALALARFTLHFLNLNTAFLVSIILGNGINAPIILVARYGEQRRHGQGVGPALATAMAATLRGTSTAMLGCSIAYCSLMSTAFRGFSQFGLVGGAGMLLVWLLTFAVTPALVELGERWWPGAFTPRPSFWRRPFARLGRWLRERPGRAAALVLVSVAACLAPLCRYARDPLEWNFDRLRSVETESQRRWGEMEKLGLGSVGAGYIANTGVLLVDDAAQAEPVAEALRSADRARGSAHVLAQVRTLGSLLPSDQRAKLSLLSRMREQIDRHCEHLTADERRRANQLRPPDWLRPLTVDDLPRRVREAFTEIDGRRGRLIGIDADPVTYHDWNGHDLLRLSRALTVDALGRRWVAASAGGVFAGMLETLLADGPRVTLLALAGVTLLILLAFGPSGAVPVWCALATGLIWMGGVAGLIGLKLNFMNFVALPITLGVGVDYAANLWARLRTDGRRGIAQAVEATGSAVALCSLTTIIGYSSLLFSRNRALRSFGLLADLGELSCLAASLLLLPLIARLYCRERSAFVGARHVSKSV